MNFREQIQKEAVEELLIYEKGTANVAMRLGKTFIGLKIGWETDWYDIDNRQIESWSD